MTTTVTFHGLGLPPRALDAGEDAVWLGIDAFTGILDVVAEHPSELVVTFDDGNRSDVEVALPSLLERGLRATFFVLAGRLGTPGFLAADDVRALRSEGMGVGTHGMDHVDWRRIDDGALTRELERSRSVLEDIVGEPVVEAACPFGSYDRRVLRHLRASGYQRVYTSDGGATRGESWLVPRSSFHRDDDASAAQAMLHPAGAATAARSRVKRWLKRLR